MKTRSALFAALVLASALFAPAMTVTTNLFEEAFSKATGQWSASSTFRYDTSWTKSGSVFGALGGAKLGSNNGTGTITSDTIPLRQANASANLSIYVQAAGYPPHTNGVLKLTALDANGDELRQWTTNLAPADVSTATDLSDMESAASFDFTFDFATSVPFKLSITTGGGDKRVLVGEVRVTETYDDGRIQLATPVVSVSPDVHQLLLFFTSVDEHATDFELEVLDPEGREAGTQQLYPGFGFMVTDLEEGTTYTVRLRAIGDGVVYAPSEWYEDQISTMADNWQPVWTVGTPDSLPTIGKEFSFGVSAALNGTPQTVSFVGLTPAAPGAQPVFSGGVFSWTPGDEAAGSYTAAFSVVNQGGTYTTDVAFRVRGSTEEATLFFEPFSGSANNTASWASTAQIVENGAFVANIATNAGWTGTTGLRKAPSAILFGTATTAKGSATSPAVFLRNGASSGTATISFHAATKNAGRSLSMSVLDGEGNVVSSRTFALATLDTSASNLDGDAYSADASGDPLTATLSVPSPFRLFFEPAQTDSCLFLDSVKVTQQVSTSLDDLGTPADLAVVDGTLSTNSFSIAWTPVANATNYAVEVYAAGGLQPVLTLALAAPPAALAGLSDDTSYTVRVRAEGDTELYNYSPWTSVSVRTLRSALNPTLTVGPWSNAANENLLYGVIRNTADVSAELDDHTPVDVSLAGVSPSPSGSPALADGTLSWTPAESDEGKTFTLTFAMTPSAGVVYETNVSFRVLSLPGLEPPAVAVAEPVAWNAIGLSWNTQYRASGYTVRAWTDCPNPNATATRIDEPFHLWPTNRPFGWTFDVAKDPYKNAAAPVKLEDDGDWMATYDLGGAVTNVSFVCKGASMNAKNGSDSVLSVYWSTGSTNKADWIGNLLGSVANLGNNQTTASFPVAPVYGARTIVWRFSKANGGVGVGSVVIEGEGFSTPRFLSGWGPTERNVGLVQACTVANPRPGRYLGVNPANRKEDLTEPRVHYAEVTVRDAAGASFATVVAADVPAPPRSVRATLMILK